MARGVVKNIRSRSNISDRRDESLGLLDVTVGIFPIPGTPSVNKSGPSVVFDLGRVHVEHSINGGAPSQDFTPRLGHHTVVHMRLRTRQVLPIVRSSDE